MAQTHPLLTARERAGLTRAQLAARVKVTRQRVLQLEREDTEPGVGLALRIAFVVGVPVHELWPGGPVDCPAAPLASDILED